MVGIAMRAAFSLGLHVQQHDDQTVSAARRQSMICTWWSLHSLESLLSSITGRPSIIPNEDITTPLPGVLASSSDQHQQQQPQQTQQRAATGTINLDFLDADTNLNLLTQQIISNLYTQRRSAPSWDYLQQATVSLVGDLDKWAVDHLPELRSSQEWNNNNPASYRQQQQQQQQQQREGFLLKLQYYRLKILSTRPSLRRVERCFEAGTDDFNSLDQSVADTCVRAAQDVASLLVSEPHVKSLYEKGPWWTIVHNSKLEITFLNVATCLTKAALFFLLLHNSHASTRRPHDRHLSPRPLPRRPRPFHPSRPPARLVTPRHVRHQRARGARLPFHLFDRQDERAVGLG
jgi:hypothetical protein